MWTLRTHKHVCYKNIFSLIFAINVSRNLQDHDALKGNGGGGTVQLYKQYTTKGVFLFDT